MGSCGDFGNLLTGKCCILWCVFEADIVLYIAFLVISIDINLYFTQAPCAKNNSKDSFFVSGGIAIFWRLMDDEHSSSSKELRIH